MNSQSIPGNTLAYALNSLQNLMEHDHGWENFTRDFVGQVSIFLFYRYFI